MPQRFMMCGKVVGCDLVRHVLVSLEEIPVAAAQWFARTVPRGWSRASCGRNVACLSNLPGLLQYMTGTRNSSVGVI